MSSATQSTRVMSAPPLPKLTATGRWYELPEELFEPIVKRLPSGDVYQDRSQLKACSLVNRYWAAHIRPFIFYIASVDSRRSALALLSFVGSDTIKPNIGTHIRELHLFFETARDLPWLHIIWNLLFKGTLPHAKYVSLLTDGDGTKAMRSPFYGNLPRFVPSIHTAMKHRLFRTEFRRFRDLLYCINSIDAQWVFCMRVSWLEDASLLSSDINTPAHARHHSIHTDREIELEYCTAVSPFVWSLVTTQPRGLDVPYSQHYRAYVHSDQVHAVLQLVQYFSDDCRCSCCALREPHRYILRKYNDPTFEDGMAACISVSSEEAHILTIHVHASGFISRITLSIYYSRMQHPDSGSPLAHDEQAVSKSTPQSTPSDTTSVTHHDEQPTFDSQDTAPFDTTFLTHLDKYATALDHTLQDIIINVFDASVSEMRTFVHLAIQKMPRMYTTNRLRFRYRLDDDVVILNSDKFYWGEHDAKRWTAFGMGEIPEDVDAE